MESWLAESYSRQCAEMQLNYPAILHVLPKQHWKTWRLAAEATAASLSPVPGRRSWQRQQRKRKHQDWSPEKPRSGQLAKKKTSFGVSRASQLVNTEGAVRTRGTRMETLLGRLRWSPGPQPSEWPQRKAQAFQAQYWLSTKGAFMEKFGGPSFPHTSIGVLPGRKCLPCFSFSLQGPIQDFRIGQMTQRKAESSLWVAKSLLGMFLTDFRRLSEC